VNSAYLKSKREELHDWKYSDARSWVQGPLGVVMIVWYLWGPNSLELPRGIVCIALSIWFALDARDIHVRGKAYEDDKFYPSASWYYTRERDPFMFYLYLLIPSGFTLSLFAIGIHQIVRSIS
jgi:hypothetical protein